MTMLICIPSAGRADKPVTLSHFRKYNLLDRVRMIVPAKQVAKYQSYLGDRVAVVGEPEGNKGIADTRAWILRDYALSEGFEHVLMLDDDMDFCRRHNVEEPKLFTIEKREDFCELLDDLHGWLQEGWVHVGLSARQGNNRPYYDESTPRVYGLHRYKDATRMMNGYAYNVRRLKELRVRFGRVPVMEDFDLTLQLLRMGHPNRVMFEFCWNQRGSGKTGGCSTYRTPDIQRQGAERLKELHPDFVKVVMKKSAETSDAWKGMKERPDADVAWRKAFESSGRKVGDGPL